jgi:cysteinyl-tRNA synthetase
VKNQFPVSLFNTKKREKVVFKPINDDFVGMYVCGPTVYGHPHLGNARGAMTFDIVFRYLEYIGYKVRYVRNITDVGHLENEVDESGEDKIAKQAKLNQLEPMEIVQTYTISYHKAMESLNVRRPSIEPTATGHIIEQIEIVQKIIDNGFAYESEGSVYFDMSAYLEKHKYGELSGKIVKDLMSGSRSLDGQQEKKSSLDFALWKAAKPEHIMKWPSPWGIGFPGWHLECTAMSSKYLGIPFDIHGGGMDLQFPHHEGEIAQSQCAFHSEPANYWLHNNMLTIDGQKMAKSKGNFLTLDELFSGEHELLEQAYSPMTIRFFTLQSHYGSTIDFSNAALQASEKGYKRLVNSLNTLNSLQFAQEAKFNPVLDKEINDLIDSCFLHMSDDFNTARTVATMFDLSKKINDFKAKPSLLNKIKKTTFERLQNEFSGFFFDVLGLQKETENDSKHLDGAMNVLIEMRKKAKEDKDYGLSDKIRDELKEHGILLQDEKEGEMSYMVE